MYALRTVMVFLVGLLVILSTEFVILRVLPGDPALFAMPRSPGSLLPPDAMNEIQDIFAEPLISQYFHFIGDMLSGEFYYSYAYNTEVSEFIYTHFWRTVALFVASLSISILLGVVYGYLSARRRTHVSRQFASLLPLAALSSSILAVSWISTRYLVADLELFPIGYPSPGYVRDSLIVDLLGNTQLAYSILPVLMVVFVSAGAFALIIRDGYVVGGRLNTPSSERPSYGSDGLFISLPNLHLFVAFVMCCVFVVEVILAYGGLGYLLVLSLQRIDYFVIQATVFLGAALVFIANMVVYTLVTVLRSNRCLDLPCHEPSSGPIQIRPTDGRVLDSEGTSTPKLISSEFRSLARDYLRSPVGLIALVIFVALVGIAAVGTQVSVFDLDYRPAPYDPLALFLAGAVAPVSFTLMGGVVALMTGALIGVFFDLTRRYSFAPVQGLFVGFVSIPMVFVVALLHYVTAPSYWGSMLRLSFVISFPIAILIGHGYAVRRERLHSSQKGLGGDVTHERMPTIAAWGLNGLKYGLIAALTAMFVCDFLSFSRWESWGRSVDIAYEFHLMYVSETQGLDYLLPAFAGIFLLLSCVFLILDTAEAVVRRRYRDA